MAGGGLGGQTLLVITERPNESPSSNLEEELAVGTSLEAIEESLTKDVPSLLETMNNSSAEVNSLENDAASAQQQYKQLLLDWTTFVEDMRAKHGQVFDSVRPYFDAVHRSRVASKRAQGIARTFTAVSSQCQQAKVELRKIEGELAFGAHNVVLDLEQQEVLSRATVRALESQQQRDKCESEYSRVLREYEDTKAELERCRAVVGQAQIRRMMPCFQELQNRQYNLADRQKRINVLQERIRVAKNSYHQSLRGLDRISTAVHEARKAHAALATKSVDEKLQETLVPRCKSSPELCPEIDHPSEELGTLKNLVCAGESFAFGDPSSVRENVADKCRQEATTPPEVTQSFDSLCHTSEVSDSPFA